jgi:SAM-dependent methyltransferase
VAASRIDKLAKRILPLWIRLPIRYIRFKLGLIRQAIEDKLRRSQYGGVPLPGPLLRYRVQGEIVNATVFLNTGLNCAQDLRSATGRVGRDFYGFEHILDFGCGCGRILRWYYDVPDSCRIQGTDIDARAVEWCRENIPFAAFETNGHRPPLRYDDNAFDLVLALSVLNHMDAEGMDEWLRELKRVSRPGGILLISTSGRTAQRFLDEQDRKKVEEKGFLYMKGQTGFFKLDGLPDYYQMTYQTREDAMERFGKHFKVLDYLEGGLGNTEDLVILQKE